MPTEYPYHDCHAVQHAYVCMVRGPQLVTYNVTAPMMSDLLFALSSLLITATMGWLRLRTVNPMAHLRVTLLNRSHDTTVVRWSGRHVV
jgi:hypothetical protein